MAAVKVQSLDDIVSAYLQDLRIPAELVPEWAAAVQGDDVIAALNDLLLPTAEQVYPERYFDKAQKIAGFKLVWLSLGGGELHPGQKPGDDLQAALKEKRLVPAPKAEPHKMQPQRLEAPHLKWTGKKA